MKPLDLNTLVTIIAAISLLFGFLMMIFSRINPTIKGPMHWSVGSFSIVLGSLLFSMTQLNGFVVYVGSGVFAILGMGLYWSGIRAFKEEPVNYFLLGALVFSQLLFGSLFYLVFDMPNARMASYSTIAIVVFCLSIWELLKPTSKAYRLAFNITLIVFIVSTLTSLFRIYNIVTTLPAEAHNPTLANILVYFFINFTQAMLIFSFMMMVSVKVSEKLKTKVEAQNKFFSIISHDLIGPVGLIHEILNLANNDEELDKEQRSVILKEVEKLSGSTYHLLQNLLFWSRNQMAELHLDINQFDLNKVIVENLELFVHISRKKGIHMEYDPKPDLKCLADVRMIDTVVRNLISNSMKFTRSGGKVVITCENNGQKVYLKIADTGIGMNNVILKNVFNFNEIGSKPGTEGEKGTGLGLYLCKEFVEKNGGELSIDSLENKGTEVNIVLPAG